jgi:transposase InsO family protein
MVIAKYKDLIPVRWLCAWTGMPVSSWYYSSTDGRRGCKPSRYTFTFSGNKVSNKEIISRIKELLRQEYVCYGYEKITSELRDDGFLINKKKVYRLMKEAHLLHGNTRIRTNGRRNFVKMRKIEADYPMQYLAMDIKYVYIQGERRNVYLLSIMDIFTRRVLGHLLKGSIRQHDVVLLLDGIIGQYRLKKITIRNDNGSQFIAHSVRKYLHEMGINQEFTHIATPEENAYIESLHSTLEREVIRRYWFDSIHYAKWKISDYYKFYNARRKHRSLGMRSPDQYLDNYEKMNQKKENDFQILLN